MHSYRHVPGVPSYCRPCTGNPCTCSWQQNVLLAGIGSRCPRWHLVFASSQSFRVRELSICCCQGRTGGKKWARSYCETCPSNTRHAAHSVHGVLPTQYTARCPLNASHVSTSQWPTWKNTHTLNIILDDYKEITSYMFFFFITFGSTNLPGWTHGIK